MRQPGLFDAATSPDPDTVHPPDQAARDFAVDPANVVVLEASAGTGKTRVLVDRYGRLIQAGVEPRHILAMTFTRKAAAEMRDRVLVELRRRADRGELPAGRWRDLREHVGDIQISTIDAFCFGLLREFPLEADVNPAFEIADETEMARFANEALDLTLRAARALIVEDENVRLLFARIKQPVLRDAIGALLDRRDVALPAVATFVQRHAACPSAAAAAMAFVGRIRDLIRLSPYRGALLDDGPLRAPEFEWLRVDLAGIDDFPAGDAARVQSLRRRLERHFLTQAGLARQQLARALSVDKFASKDARRRHELAVKALSPGVLDALAALDADVNGLLARGLLRVLTVAVDKYERLLDDHAVIDFAGMLSRAVALLERQEEFARSRLKLQARYHHVLVDEFQDTSRAQWRLVELLIAAWGEGEGAADAPTSIFIVGDRKQSIYRFRHAEATLLEEAARRIAALRPGRPVRHAITHSFRAVPELLAFVNALADQLQSGSSADDRFQYGETDRFVLAPGACDGRRDGVPVVGLIAESSTPRAASAVAAEVERLLVTATVRDRDGAPRAAKPDDIVILFRARAGHQYFEDALEARGIRTYVYKGLGFFDVAEVQDLQALLRYLARPESDLRAAEFLRSRLVRLSDVGLAALAPDFAAALRPPDVDPDLPESEAERPRDLGSLGALGALGAVDAALLARARTSVARWLGFADRVPPSELIDLILRESAYVYEMRGRRLEQARENVKKVRSLVRRVESRGYATLERLADYFSTLQAGDESNAIVAASGCVNLMTIHAAKGLEFPIVFVVNLQMPGRGRPAGFSVIERGPTGEPDVAFGQTEATRAEEERDAEELRRLLYVAVTRARDRLYLAAEVDEEGQLRRGARSLAALLPVGLAAAVSAIATTEADCVTWEIGDSAFALAVCRAADPAPTRAPIEAASPEVLFDLEGVSFSGPSSVSAAPAPAGALERVRRRLETGPDGLERLIGTLVHRLFQRRVDRSLDASSLAASVAALLRVDEASGLADPDTVCAAAAALYQRMAGRSDLVELLESGECHYEVPFSFHPADRPGEVVRGAIDCLIVSPSGPVTVVEFKTGDPRPEHDVQGALYASAVRELLPNRRVEVRIVYPRLGGSEVHSGGLPGPNGVETCR